MVITLQKKVFILFQNWRFFYPVPFQANLLSGKNIFSLKKFWIHEIKENFISFRNKFLKNEKNV